NAGEPRSHCGRSRTTGAGVRPLVARRRILKQQGMGMSGAGIDACCLIDLLATGQVEAILRAAGFDWHLPTAVEGEVRYVRQHDPVQPGQFVLAPVDLSRLKALGVLQGCAPANLN